MLNYDFCKRSIIDCPLGLYGKHEGLDHFFLACKKYSIGRLVVHYELVNIDINLLICGGINLPLKINNRIFADVHNLLRIL